MIRGDLTDRSPLCSKMEFLDFALLWHGIIGLCLGSQSYAGAVYYEKADNSQPAPALDVERSQRFLENPADVHIFVSPSGSDTKNDGLSQGKPFKSIAKALSLVPHYQGRDVYVELLHGYHDLDKTLNIHHTDSRKLTIRALYGSGHEVHVTGGKRLDSSLFKPVTDHQILSRLPVAARSHVRVASLADVNITDYGSIRRYGFYHSRTAPLEVFYNGIPLTLARWPNQGYINIVGLVDGATGRSFKYNSQRPASWRNEQEIWTYGFWKWSWADRAVKVQSLNTANMTVTLAEKTTFGLTTGNWNENAVAQNGYRKQGGYFRFFNILSELDQPGEYYVDKLNGRLYVWMPNSNGSIGHSDIVYASMINNCISIQKGSRNIVIKDFTLEACRAIGIFGVDSTNVSINFLEIRNTGGYNIVFHGHSSGVTISRCFLHDGDGAISLSGGNRKTLEPSGHVVEDNEIWRYSREGAVGYNAVKLNGGVGTLVRYNHMHVGQYDAVKYQGNNHIFEYNHIHHSCVNASDCGAFMTGRDWTTRGNTIRYNHVHHTLRLVPGADVRGVMLDDQSSGTIIKFNLFYDNQVHVNIGGGRDNIVENNVMYNATSYSMQVDGRGIRHTNDRDLNNHLKAVPYHSSVWTTMYPEMIDFDHQNKSLPEGNQIVRNLFYNEIHKEAFHGLSSSLNKAIFFNITQSGWSIGPADFYDVTKRDFRVKCYALGWANHVNFTQIPAPYQVGPRYSYGPAYKTQVRATPSSGNGSGPCTTHAPVTAAPMGSYLPDGSAPNTLINVTKEGCWLSVSKCTGDPKAVGTYRDMWGENHQHAADNETMCFRRAVSEWKYCGSHSGEQVMAVYGPTGATTIAGDGCFFAWYGCPKHGGPPDGHVVPGKFSRDVYAEQHANAAHNEAACLSRALPQWVYCGSNKNHPVTSIYRPTGATRTAGAGCWIKIARCPSHKSQKLSFYDAWGAANLHSDDIMQACFNRATYYWEHCGSDPDSPVTAYYRPRAASHTVP